MECMEDLVGELSAAAEDAGTCYALYFSSFYVLNPHQNFWLNICTYISGHF